MKSHLYFWIVLMAHVVLTIVPSYADEPLKRRGELPTRIDLRSEFAEASLAVREQGKRGACQVFAMVGVLEFHLAHRGKKVDLSEQFIMWAANEAAGLNRVEGFNPDLLIAGLKRFGICDESLMPYVPRNEEIEMPSTEAIKDARVQTRCNVLSIKHWSSDIGFNDDDIDHITRQLARRRPVTATLCWPSGLTDNQMVDRRNLLVDRNVDGSSKNGHGVILVGYRVHDAFDGGGYFILRNSWGSNFGDKGYAKVTFQYVRKYGIDAYAVTFL